MFWLWKRVVPTLSVCSRNISETYHFLHHVSNQTIPSKRKPTTGQQAGMSHGAPYFRKDCLVHPFSYVVSSTSCDYDVSSARRCDGSRSQTWFSANAQNKETWSNIVKFISCRSVIVGHETVSRVRKPHTYFLGSFIGSSWQKSPRPPKGCWSALENCCRSYH